MRTRSTLHFFFLFFVADCISVEENGDRLFLSDVNHHRIIIFNSNGKILDAVGARLAENTCQIEILTSIKNQMLIKIEWHIIFCQIGSSPGFEDGDFESAKLKRPAASFYDDSEDCLYFVDSEVCSLNCFWLDDVLCLDISLRWCHLCIQFHGKLYIFLLLLYLLPRHWVGRLCSCWKTRNMFWYNYELKWWNFRRKSNQMSMY